MGFLRVHFVRGIFAYHVLDGHVTSRVKFDPSIQSQNFVVDNDNQFVLGNHAFDFASRQDIIPGPGWVGHLARLRKLSRNDKIVISSEIFGAWLVSRGYGLEKYIKDVR